MAYQDFTPGKTCPPARFCCSRYGGAGCHYSTPEQVIAPSSLGAACPACGVGTIQSMTAGQDRARLDKLHAETKGPNAGAKVQSPASVAPAKRAAARERMLDLGGATMDGEGRGPLAVLSVEPAAIPDGEEEIPGIPENALVINVPAWAWAHFWQEPPPGSWEFWSFRMRPDCRVGDPIVFFHGFKRVASAVVAKIEEPGRSECEGTGRFRSGFKVFWTNESFKDLRERAHAGKD